MALEEYKRKRSFDRTPEPGADLAKRAEWNFVVQKHRASHLHYDFRLELDGVLKSWAVPKGPSLDPADKRLAMQVEDHPVGYLKFEGIIPEGNYGAGTVEVWDLGTWEPVMPEGTKRATNAQREQRAREMLEKGDLKFTLYGHKLRGEFVLAHMRSRRPGSKGTEWLLIKHRDAEVREGFDADTLPRSVLSKRTIEQIAADKNSATWQSDREASSSTKARSSWLAKAIAKHDEREHSSSPKQKGTRSSATRAVKTQAGSDTASGGKPTSARAQAPRPRHKVSAKRDTDETSKIDVANLKGARKAAMPSRVQPMLATLVDEPFNSRDFLYEIKWDGYRALAYIESGRVRLVSRNQNDLTQGFPELGELAQAVSAHEALLDGEVVALDNHGRSSFSLMQQRTGLGERKGRVRNANPDVPIVYYAFDLLYLDGYSLLDVALEDRKEVLRKVLEPRPRIRFSEHFDDGLALYHAAREQGLEGIMAKRRSSCYEQKRSHAWLKLKITQELECVIAGYTDPKGSRENFGSVVLGLYDDHGQLLHVGQAGSGFTAQTHAAMWQQLKSRETRTNPFANTVGSTRRVHFVRPELVAQIKFTEWTHESDAKGGGVKMRAPVFLGLRMDKKPEDCRFERALPLSKPA
ncbi:MAG TPA: non-homologous end-joining DNA ligase [Candidatus Acidoferrales bacterium]|nr:non-homologous end-joining DNA ligase [Candidatus Acidoferrales bacterium]